MRGKNCDSQGGMSEPPSPQSTPEAPAPVEIELKFELEAARARLLRSHPALAATPLTRRMTTTYFDTPSFALRAAGFTLRVRRVGGRFIQTVKRDRGGLFDRDEWEFQIGGPRVDPAVLDETPAGKALAKTGEPLDIVAVVRTTRALREWTTPDGLVEIAVDRCEILAGARRLRFQELELELKDGSPKAILRLADELFGLTPLRLGLTSKGERGYRLAGARPAAFDPQLNAQSTVAQTFAAIGRACLDQVAEQGVAWRAAQGAEPIHQMRVGLRRLRTALRLFEDVVKDGAVSRLGGELKWLADALGPARNLDVYLADVFDADALPDADLARRYGERLQRTRKAAYAQADQAIRSPRFARLMLDLALWLEDGDWRRPVDDAPRALALAAPIPAFAAQVLEDLRRTVKKRGQVKLAKLDAERRHKLRIRCKRLRYASEFFAHAFDGGRKRREAFVEALKRLQDALGLLNDMAQAQETAARTLGRGAPQALTFAAGELVGRLRARQGKSLEKAEQGYGALMKAERFWPRPEPETPPVPAWMLAPD